MRIYRRMVQTTGRIVVEQRCGREKNVKIQDEPEKHPKHQNKNTKTNQENPNIKKNIPYIVRTHTAQL